jgi:ABC-2 type transport system permease protein
MNWEQFRAILWLRWRLTRNQLTRGSKIGAVVAAIAGAALVMIALGAGLGATLAGALAMKNASATVVMLVWDGIVFFMLLFSFLAVLTELQRSESIELTRLLHLPISLKQVFVFNYLVSLVSFGTVIGLALMLGLALGLTLSHGPRFLLAVPLVLIFVFMVTAWIYCLRGWLLSLMVNPRRRRAIIMWVTLGFILVSQSPQLLNLAWQRKARADRHAWRPAPQPSAKAARGKHSEVEKAKSNDRQTGQTEYLLETAAVVNAGVPLLWLPSAARGLAAGEVLPALWGGAGMFALGWLGLSRAYRATLRFYRAEERMKPARTRPAGPPRPAKAASNWIERQLPWLPEDTAALALAQFRSMTRAPEVRMMLALGLFMAVFLPAMIFWRGGSPMHLPEAGKPFAGTVTVVMVLFTLLQLVCNQFGCDRDGFRVLVLLPTPRERLLLGKNLAVLPLAAGIAFAPLAVVTVLAKLSVAVVLATVLQFAAAFLMYCAVGNLASILVPYRIAAGSLKPTKQSWPTALALMLIHFSFPVVISPVFLPPALGFGLERLAGLPASLVNLAGALVLAVVFAALYAFTLRPLGRLLQRRETKILRAVTEALD